MGKDSFILYSSHKDLFETLTDAQAGKLIKAIFQYEESGKIPNLSPATQMAFVSIKGTLDKNAEKYAKVVERNRENGRRGGRPKKQENPIKPTGFFGNPTKPKKADNDIYINKTKLNNLYKYIRGKEQNFENFTENDRKALVFILKNLELYVENDSSFPTKFIFELQLKYYVITELYRSSYKVYIKEIDSNLFTQKFLETVNRIPINSEEDIESFIGYLITCLRDEAIKRSVR